MTIRVEVVYALAYSQTIVELELQEGARVADALAASRLPELLGNLSGHHIGIWGILALPDAQLHDLDRVEIYRELIAEPKQARRQRARQQRATRRNR
jgi:putative ubiquitin-RnfH superfamily antitoxin RatB of RatAB toxin-antitoxin module